METDPKNTQLETISLGRKKRKRKKERARERASEGGGGRWLELGIMGV